MGQLAAAEQHGVPDSQLQVAEAGRGLKPQAPGVALPEADGKTLLSQRCVRCHNLQMATGQPGRSEQDWRQIITRMADVYGATVTQAERETLIKYLAALKP